MVNEYLNSLEEELKSQGVVSSTHTESVEDKDLKVIVDMAQKLGVNYSEEQKEILRHRGNSVILACAGSGKALLNGTPVVTDSGYERIEELKIGKITYNERGEKQVVLGVFPQEHKKRVHKVIFEDGAYTNCCDEHLWTVYPQLNSLKTKTYTTAELIDTMLKNETKEVYIPAPMFKYTKRNSDISLAIRRMLQCKEVILDLLSCMTDVERNYDECESAYDIIVYTIAIIKCIVDRYEKYEIKYANKLQVDFFRNIFSIMGAIPYINGDTVVFDKRSFSGFRKIQKIEVTDNYEDMTCIKVSGESELFVAEYGVVTHNTTISTHLIAKRILTREIPDVSKLIYTTYSRAGANEMEERLKKILARLSITNKVQVRTLHSFFLSLIKTFGLKFDIISDRHRRKLVSDACKEASFSTQDDNVTLMQNLLSYQVNNLLDDKKTLKSMYNELEDLSLEQYAQIRMYYASKKAEAGLIDYDDMQVYLYCWLCKWATSDKPGEVQMSQSVRDYCHYMFNDFYIDEAQDVSKLQFEIIKAMVVDPNDSTKLKARLTFIGDDDQCIYEWRGSNPSIIQCIGSDFNIKTSVLSTNYRCKSAIVDFATTGVKCNNRRYEKGMSAHESGGSVQVLPVSDSEDNLYNMSVKACVHIKKWIEKGYKESEIAVLSRNNRHLTILNALLLMNGIYCNCTEDMKVTKGMVYNDVKDIIEMCDMTFKKEIPGRIMWKFNHFIPGAASKAIGNFMENTAMSLQQAFGYIIKTYASSQAQFQIGKLPSVNMVASSQLKYHMEKLNVDMKDTIINMYLAMTASTQEDRFQALASLFVLGAKMKAYKAIDRRREAFALIKLLTNICKDRGFKEMQDFLRILEQFESGTVGVMGDKVTLSTVHSAKGREWRNVIMFACDNIAEPNFATIASMCDDETVSVSDIFGYIDEERRLFYVGNTRAKENLLALTSNRPSVFLLEALGADIGDAKIVEHVSDDTWFRQYKDFINDKILNSESPYFYKE